MLKHQLAEAKAQLTQRQQMEENAAEEVEVKNELAGIDDVQSEMVDSMKKLHQLSQAEQKGKGKEQMLVNAEQLLNQQAAEIQRLLGLISLQQTAAPPSNNLGLSSANPPPSSCYMGLSNASLLGPSPSTRTCPSSSLNPGPAQSGPTSSLKHTSPSGLRPSSGSFPHSSSSPAGITDSASTANVIPIINPCGRSEFITPAERRARNKKQDNLAVPRRIVQNAELSFGVASAASAQTQSSTSNAEVDNLLGQMSAAAECIDVMNTEHSHIIVNFMCKLLKKMGYKDINIWPREQGRDKCIKPGSQANFNAEKN
ncbi:hypothetical protein GYMLUDRAFT_62538 [Collybiopsis luxurians FD-317 M1]|uniref:Uncharacterized protein n=1 Tax=Collybiopsis luxurians FD-317 M1 TaxID=944289 RepID=A0A0D0BKX6_9AGAR|nr:hypothetical protein GYMLUDRAFT_62538 [Collybiopsis luxurians FD-317 M1]